MLSPARRRQKRADPAIYAALQHPVFAAAEPEDAFQDFRVNNERVPRGGVRGHREAAVRKRDKLHNRRLSADPAGEAADPKQVPLHVQPARCEQGLPRRADDKIASKIALIS